MSALSIQVPFPVFQDRDGQPLDNGYVWLGTSSLNPQTNPVVAYYDSALTIVATQPLRTLNGFISRAGSPAQVYVDAVNFSILVQDRQGTTVFSVPEGTGISPNASGVVYDPAGTGAVATTVQAKLRESVSVLDFGADSTGATDSGAAIRSAVAAVTTNGGSVYFPPGTYKVAAAGGDTSNTAIYVPSNVRIVGASQVGTKIVPGANNVVCFRVQGLNGGIENLQIDNVDTVYSNVSGIRLAPTDEAQVITRSDIEFNNFTNLSIRHVAEAIVLRPGPTVTGQDSYSYYNTFTNIDIRNCTIGVWLKEPPTQPGSGNNRNTFISCRVGETGCNTGLKIDAGDTNKFIACSFEGIGSGVSPNATPTAVQIAYNTISYGCVNNQFYGLIIEACTRDMDNDNDETEVYGWFHTGTYYSPSSRPLAVDIRNDALVMNAPIRGTTVQGDTGVGTGRTPTILGDFYTATGNASLKAISGASGAAEVGADTPGNYGYLTLSQLGVKQWSIGSIGSGINHIGFFNAGESLLAQMRDTGELRPGSDNLFPLGSASFRWSVVYAGTGTINTSDARTKQQVRDLSSSERAVAVRCKSLLRAFKFNDSVAQKGDKARIHFGVIAQEVKAAFESEGLIAEDYALFCYDEWQDEYVDVEEKRITVDDSGREVAEYVPTGEKKLVSAAGSRYGIRYEELLAFVISAL